MTLPTCAIVGLGLMGGSVAAAIKSAVDVEVVGFDEDRDALAEALRLGLIDRGADSVSEAAQDAGLVVIAVPVLAIEGVLAELVGREAQLTITDVGSVKQSVIDAATRVFGVVPPCFVPGHPIAGSERHGVNAARADLFRDHRVVLTPTGTTDPDALALVRHLWATTGAEVLEMSVAEHDAVLARTSHLPHLLAYALVDSLSAHGTDFSTFRFAAGGFRDFTRIAGSDAVMWRDIFASNSHQVVPVLDQYIQDLSALRAMMMEEDWEGLRQVFERARQARARFQSTSSSPTSEPPLSPETPGSKAEK
jgi:3-phosphoshikimate 1-carboxyvinyltransferase